MKLLKTFFLFYFSLNLTNTFSQEGNIKLNQDPKLTELMKLKKEVNIETFTSGQYTIQIFNGKYNERVSLKMSRFDLIMVHFIFEQLSYRFKCKSFKQNLL